MNEERKKNRKSTTEKWEKRNTVAVGDPPSSSVFVFIGHIKKVLYVHKKKAPPTRKKMERCKTSKRKS